MVAAHLPSICRCHRFGRGFSLLEVMVVCALVAILAGLALPSLNSLLLRRSLQASAEALVADLRLARSEAIKRATRVAVCSSADGLACSPSAAWREGWIVFVDRDDSRSRAADEELLRVRPAPAGLASLGSERPANDNVIVSYHPTGWAKAASQTLIFKPQTGPAPARVVCISSQGRPRLRPEGVSRCS